MQLDIHPIKTPLIVIIWFCLWSIIEKGLYLMIGNNMKRQIISHIVILFFITIFIVLYPENDELTNEIYS
jgi:hypothetical protein